MKKINRFLCLTLILSTCCSFIPFASASEKNKAIFDNSMEIPRSILRKSAYGKNILEKSIEVFKVNRINNGILIKNFVIKFENKHDYDIAEKYWRKSKIEEPEIWKNYASRTGFYVDIPIKYLDKFKNYCYEHNLTWDHVIDEHDKRNEKIFFYFNDDNACTKAINIVETFFNV